MIWDLVEVEFGAAWLEHKYLLVGRMIQQNVYP